MGNEKGKDTDSSNTAQAKERQKGCQKEREAREQYSMELVISVERLGTHPRDAQSWERGSKGIATGVESRGTPRENAQKARQKGKA